jgi:NACalpha-BTF3-like transcription factor
MAVIGSNSGGYATVNPTQGNAVGDALSNVENSALRFRYEQREKDRVKLQAEKDLSDNRRRDFSESQQFSKDNPFVSTGTGLDAVNRQSYMNAKGAANKAYTEYLKTGDVSQQAIYENAVASVNNISKIPEQINSIKESWVKNVGDYNPRSLKSKASILDQISSGQIVQTNDERGNATYTVFDKDEQGNVSKLIRKNLTGEQLLNSLRPEKAFNINGKDGFIDLFNEGIGKQRTITVGTGLNATEKTFNPGAEELSKIMADEAVNDRSKMYETLSRMGLDPEDEKNYTNTTVLDNASNYLQKILMVTAPTTSSDKPNVQLLQYQRGLKNDAQSQNNFVKNFNQKQKENDDKSEGGGKVRITIKDGILGIEETVSETMSKADYEKLKKDKANAEAKLKEYNTIAAASFSDEVGKVFSGNSQPKAKQKTKAVVNKNSFSEDQIKYLMTQNPGVPREAIIEALNNQ